VVKPADVILKMSKTDFNHVFDEFQKHSGVLSSGEPILTGNTRVMIMNKGGMF
jgi:hypothetical protein